MAISDAHFQDWLITDAVQRVVLVELAHADGTEYISRGGYADTVNQRVYADQVSGVVGLESRLDGGGSLGRITVINDGSLDGWIDLDFRGFPIAVYLGDKSWPVAEFRNIARGVNGGLSGVSAGTLQFDVESADFVLDVPITTAVVPSGALEPVTLGQPFNITPVVTNISSLSYQLNEGAITSATVKDMGNAVSHTPDYAHGKTILVSSPIGAITADPVEPTLTPAAIVNWLCARSGVTPDAASLAALPTYTLGLYYDSDTPVKRVLEEVCTSIGAYYHVNALNELEVHQLLEPAGTADFTIGLDELEDRGMSLVRVEEPVSLLTLNYARNYTVQNWSDLAGVLSDAQKNRLSTEWLSVTAVNATTRFPLAQPQTIDTYLTSPAHAQTECNRISALKNQRREVWRLKCLQPISVAFIGQTVKITHPRFGFAAGKNARVINVKRSPSNNRTTLEVWL